jgi:hypothetical protein
MATDATLQLKMADGDKNDKNGGFITVHLGTDTQIQTGAIAIINARQDIESSGIANSVAAGDSKAVQDADRGLNADPQNAFQSALEGVVSKLDIFVQIVDQTSKVCVRGGCVRNDSWAYFCRSIHTPTLLGK